MALDEEIVEADSSSLSIIEPAAIHNSVEHDNSTENVSYMEKKPEDGDHILGNMKRKFHFFRQEILSITCLHGDKAERTRLYHVWPGNNVFFFRGRLVCGPDPKGLLLSVVSICLSSWIFVAYVAIDFPHNSSITISCLIITLIVLMSLVWVSMTDPGIIPRNEQSRLEGSEKRRSKREMVNEIEVKVKYCLICNIYRPPRACHCAICDNCVERFDHHCPWLGQCIGLRNYRHYMVFLFMGLIFFVYISTFSVQNISRKVSRNKIKFMGLLKECPETLALASFSLVTSWLLGALNCYHVYLVAVNQTAYENFRQQYRVSRNPYDKGIWSNIKEVLFMSQPASKVDFRAEVQTEGSSESC